MSTAGARLSPRDLQFSLMFFACSERPAHGSVYDLVVDCARFGDREGFTAVWVPERHFTEFGYPYPNPAVLHAAIARETDRIQLRAGSVVAPLHHPLRIAEEWAMVDNLSGGRVGVSFASGWNPNDFAFHPDRYPDRHEVLYESLATVQRLWRGESIEVMSGSQKPASVRVYPPPVQRELPVWVTAAGNPKTFARAGAIGANVLTHLLDHGVEQIADRIRGYREARESHGHDPDAGRVTIMMHTFLGANADEVREIVRAPYCGWLKSNAELLKGLAANRGGTINLDALSDEDRDAFVNMLFERFYSSRSLMGTPETCLDLVARLQSVGVNEVACLLDFGPAHDLIVAHLPFLKRLKELYQAREEIAPAIPSRARPIDRAADATAPQAAAEPSLAEIRARCQEVPVGEFYDMICRFGVQVEGRFRGVQQLWRRDGEALGRIRLMDGLGWNGEQGFHPAFLDACLQVFAATLPASSGDGDALYLPVGLDEFEASIEAPRQIWSHAVLRPDGTADQLDGDIRLIDDRGRVVGRITRFRLQRNAKTATAPEDVGEWLYDVRWVERPLDEPAAGGERRRWLVLADRGGTAESLVEALRSAGDACVLVYGDERGADEGRPARVDWTRRAHDAIAGAIVDASMPFDGVVHMWSLDVDSDEPSSPDAFEADEMTIVGSALGVAQALASADRGVRRPRVWLVTRGAQAIDGEPRPVSPLHTALWGFGKCFAVEHSELWGGLVDLDPSAAAGAGIELAAVVRGAGGEDQIALRGPRAYVPRLARRRDVIRSAISFRPDAAYLVTGGLGGIGVAVANWLVRNGARHLVLIGRQVPPPRDVWTTVAGGTRAAQQIAAIEALERQGAQVTFASVDVADAAQLGPLLDQQARQGPPLRGVFHAAGVGRAEPLLNADRDHLNDVLRPKANGGWLLHQFLRDREIDCFVLFSSATHQLGVLGHGLAAYSAASAFLDGLAHHRRSAGLHALSLDWGPWGEVGMAAATNNLERLHRFGIGAVSPRAGTDLLGHFLNADATQPWAIPVDWPALMQTDPALARAPFLADLGVASDPHGPDAVARAALREALRQLPTPARARRLEGYIQEQIAAVMRLDSVADVDWRRGLFEIGMDSLMALELKNRLQAGLGVAISSTLAFDHPTVASIAGFLSTQMFPETETAAPERPVDVRSAAVEQKVAAAADAVRGLDDREIERLLAEKTRD